MFSPKHKNMKPNRNIGTEWAKVLFCVWEDVLFYTQVNVFLLIAFSETFFVLQEWYTYKQNSDAKKVFKTPRKIYILVWLFIEKPVFI